MSAFSTAFKRAFAQPAFIAAVLVLGLCAATLNSAIHYLQIKFDKKAMPLRVLLPEGIPKQLGHWVMISTDHSINPEIEEVLGTSQYVFRDYVDDRKIGSADIELLKNTAAADRDILLAKIQATNPSAILRIGVTYYTGALNTTVAHVPDRCYVADGYEISQHQTRRAPANRYADGKSRSLNYSFLAFEDQTAVGRQVQRVSPNVGYVFICNGIYCSGANEVRLQLQNPFEPYVYYAKVEMMTVAQNLRFADGANSSDSQDTSAAAMEDFLAQALPEIEKCLPDWQTRNKK